MFKKGDKVICVDRDCRHLTYGKEYTVLRKSEKFIKVTDDSDEVGNYYNTRFNKLEEEEMFKVEDKVWSCNYGWGTVIEINKTTTYPVLVKFLYGKEEYAFTYDGRILTGEFRTLFFEEIPIPESALTRPKWTPNIGEPYYFIDCFGEVSKTYPPTRGGDRRIEIGNCFKTQEEATDSRIYKVFHEEDK